MMMFRCRVVIFAAMWAGQALAQSDGKKATPEGVAEVSADDRSQEAAAALALDPRLKQRFNEFFQRLKQRETRLAYARLLEGSRLSEQREVVDKLVSNTDETLRTYGKIEEVELVGVESGARTLKEVRYVVSTEQRPVQWTFLAYYGGGKWQMLDLSVTGDLAKILPSRQGAVAEPQ